MSTDSKLKVVLFGLTGFGNAVLQALLEDDRVVVQAVFTVKYDNPFPYYAEQQLLDMCAQQGIVCHADIKVGSAEGLALLGNCAPDLILMATFKQIIKENVLSLPRLGFINFHPSLLPKYRGPSPTNTALLNDEKFTGVTVHYVTDRVDEGNILLQKSISIDEMENDGQLRRKLSSLSAKMVPEIITMFSGATRPVGTPQDHSLATLAPKPAVEDGCLEQCVDVNAIQNRVRAFNPLPGTSYAVGDQRIVVDRFQLVPVDGPDGIYDEGDTIKVILDTQAIRLFKKIN